MSDHALLELLYKALHSPAGIIVSTADPERLRQKLYTVRKSDSDLDCLSFVTSPTAPKTELFILRKETP